MTAPTGPAVALSGVVKRFGTVTALDGIDLEAGPGETLTLLGPNGAGKTTAIRVMLGLRRPDAGSALLFGRDPRHPASRRLVGATPQELELPGTLRVAELVEFVGRHFESPASPIQLLQRFALVPLARRQVGGLSAGERRRVAVALAFAGRPAALFLDEPTTGLDVESRRAVWEAIGEFVDGGGTVLLTTHSLEEASRLSTRVAIMREGRIVRTGSVAELTRPPEFRDLESVFLELTGSR